MTIDDLIKFSGNDYIQRGEEEKFPWEERTNIVWYALFIFYNGEVKSTGYTSSKSSKGYLIDAMIDLQQDKVPFTLIGIWHGHWRTDLFVLDPKIAIKKLKKVI